MVLGSDGDEDVVKDGDVVKEKTYQEAVEDGSVVMVVITGVVCACVGVAIGESIGLPLLVGLAIGVGILMAVSKVMGWD